MNGSKSTGPPSPSNAAPDGHSPDTKPDGTADLEREKLRLEESRWRAELEAQRVARRYEVMKWGVATAVACVGAIATFFFIDLQEQDRLERTTMEEQLRLDSAERREWLKEYLNAADTEDVTLWSRKLNIIAVFLPDTPEMNSFVDAENVRIRDILLAAQTALDAESESERVVAAINEAEAGRDEAKRASLEKELDTINLRKADADAFLLSSGVPTLPEIVKNRSPSAIEGQDLRVLRIGTEAYRSDEPSRTIRSLPDPRERFTPRRVSPRPTPNRTPE